MAAAVYNITIDAQSDFSRTFQVNESGTPVNIAGYSFAAQIREHFTHTAFVAFTTEIVNDTQGLFGISLTDDVTAQLTPGKQYYDIVMTDADGRKTRLLQGDALVSWGITR